MLKGFFPFLTLTNDRPGDEGLGKTKSVCLSLSVSGNNALETSSL